MANNDWINRTTKQHLSHMSPGDMGRRFGTSFVDTDGHGASTAEWIYNPDLSAVAGFASSYWTIAGDTVTLISQAQRDAVDVQIQSDNRDSTTNQLDGLEDLLRSFALVVLDEFNVLRAQHGLNPRTIAQLKSAIRSKLGS